MFVSVCVFIQQEHRLNTVRCPLLSTLQVNCRVQVRRVGRVFHGLRFRTGKQHGAEGEYQITDRKEVRGLSVGAARQSACGAQPWVLLPTLKERA